MKRKLLLESAAITVLLVAITIAIFCPAVFAWVYEDTKNVVNTDYSTW